MRYRLPAVTKRLLVESLVFPHIQYCLSVWGSCTATQRYRVQKALNFAARIVSNAGYRDRVTPVLRELRWMRVDDMLYEHDVMLMRDLVTSPRAPEMLRERVVHRCNVSSRTTRATSDTVLQPPRARTEFSRRSFWPRACGAWNGLPSDVRASAAGSANSFRSAVRSHLWNR